MALPVHGFVLAGGQSTRMRRDKATLPFRGRPLVEIAVEKLRGICAEVSIVGNRDDLAAFAPVVREERVDCGPAAGMDAGLKAAMQPWAMFVPVDVPLVPAEFLRRWMEEALHDETPVSYLLTLAAGAQPAFCMVRRDLVEDLSKVIDDGARRVEHVLSKTAAAAGTYSRGYDERQLYPGRLAPGDIAVRRWFVNVNTPSELAAAETADV